MQKAACSNSKEYSTMTAPKPVSSSPTRRNVVGPEPEKRAHRMPCGSIKRAKLLEELSCLLLGEHVPSLPGRPCWHSEAGVGPLGTPCPHVARRAAGFGPAGRARVFTPRTLACTVRTPQTSLPTHPHTPQSPVGHL